MRNQEQSGLHETLSYKSSYLESILLVNEERAVGMTWARATALVCHDRVCLPLAFQVSPMALGVLGVSRSQATAQAGKPRPEGAVRLNPVSVPATAHSATQGRPVFWGRA